MIVLRILNPKTNLDKKVDVTEYTKQEKCKLFDVYTKAGYGVYVVEGVEQIIEGARK